MSKKRKHERGKKWTNEPKTRMSRTNGAQSVSENKAVKSVFAFTSYILDGSETGSHTLTYKPSLCIQISLLWEMHQGSLITKLPLFLS